MADQFKFVQAQSFSLSGAGVVAGATTVILKSFTEIDGTLLTMSNFGAIGFGTLEPGNGTLEEQICFTGVTQNANGTATLTGVKNVLFVSPYTQTSGVDQTHAGSTTFVISNTSGFYDSFTAKADDETITGLWEFPNDANTPLLGSSYVAPTLNNQIASKGYADSLTFSGAPDATTTQKGIVELATQAEVDAKTATGGTGASLVATPALNRWVLGSDYVVDTGATNAYVITPSPAIAAYATGQIFTFKSTNTNTLTSTLNVNAKGAVTIQRQGVALGAGDIISGQIYMVEYDGTNFQLISAINTTPSGAIQMFAGAAAPTGWVLCDGTSYLRATYPVLFAAIGTTFGTADGTHFNVPDMRGRAPIGAGTGTGGGASGTGLPTGGSALTARALAAWIGEETHTLTTPEMPAHTHTLTNGGDTNAGSGVSQSSLAASAVVTTSSTGGGGAHNNVQPIMTLNFIIKV